MEAGGSGYTHPPTWCWHLRRRGDVWQVVYNMKPIMILGTTAAARSYDCDDICISMIGWRDRLTDAIIEFAGSKE